MGKDAVMKTPSGEEKTLTPVPKPVKDNKRKRASTSEDPKLKIKTARKPRKKTIPLTKESSRCQRDKDEEEEEEEKKNDGSILVARVKKTIDASKATGSIAFDEAPSRTEGMSEKDSGKVLEFLEIEDASHRSQQMVGIYEGVSPEALRTEGNAPSDSLGEIVIGDSPTLPAFSEWAIREDRALETHEALALYQEEFSKSRTELSRREDDFRGLSEERNALKLLNGQKEEEIKDLRAELGKAYQDQTDLTEQVLIILKTHGLNSGTVANISISQLQQKLEVIGLFREEVDTIRVEALGWKEGMDRLAAGKETARAQLSSAESQLQGMKEKSSIQARKIEELEARLASELAKAKSKAKKAKAEVDAFVFIYRADAEVAQVQAKKAAETAQTRAYWVAELAKCQSLRETFEEIHARGFNLTEEIKKAKGLEADAGALASDDDYDDDGSKSVSESGEEPDREETTPGEK
ncbi:kinesin-like protein klpA [Nicotiana tomentosiformis]|uniref:kinesin-like protein klpA n=1 Tax=Nicotiana tomentosiformis TaxID=4098 RepID=UPI00388C51E9